jgi:hypothetical protein
LEVKFATLAVFCPILAAILPLLPRIGGGNSGKPA